MKLKIIGVFFLAAFADGPSGIASDRQPIGTNEVASPSHSFVDYVDQSSVNPVWRPPSVKMMPWADESVERLRLSFENQRLHLTKKDSILCAFCLTAEGLPVDPFVWKTTASEKNTKAVLTSLKKSVLAPLPTEYNSRQRFLLCCTATKVDLLVDVKSYDNWATDRDVVFQYVKSKTKEPYQEFATRRAHS